MLEYVLFVILLLRLIYFYFTNKTLEVYASFLSIIFSLIVYFLFGISPFPVYFLTMGGFGKILEGTISLLALLSLKNFNALVLGIFAISLGFGILLRKRANRLKRGWYNFRRKLVHFFVGIFIYSLAVSGFFDEILLAVIFLLSAAFLDIIFSLLKYIPLIGRLPKELSRYYERYGEGSVYAFIGYSIALFYGLPYVILNVAVSDGLSSIYGSVLGSIKIARNRSLEGIIFGAVGALIVSKLLGIHPVFTVLPYILSELQTCMDDNLALPTFSVLLTWIFKTIDLGTSVFHP